MEDERSKNTASISEGIKKVTGAKKYHPFNEKIHRIQ
jgi:hypothetical protein